MKKLWPRVLVCAAVVLLAGAAALYLLSRPERRTVELDVPGMLLFADGREALPCRVKLDGTYTAHAPIGDGADYFDPGWGGLAVDGMELDGYLFYCYFPSNSSGYNNGLSNARFHYIANRELDLFLHELGRSERGRVFLPGEDGLAEGESVCLLVFPAEDENAARAQLDRARSQPRDDLDWLDAYSGGNS